MKKLKWLSILASVLMASALVFSGCKNDDDDSTPVTLKITGEDGVQVGKTIQLSCNEKGVSWVSSNTGVADVSSSGLVTGFSAGKATITVSKSGCTADTKEINVTVEKQTPDETPQGNNATPETKAPDAGLEATKADWVAGDGATFDQNEDGSITVTTTKDAVALKLSDAKLATLNLDYENGFYIEAMIRQDAVENTQGNKNFGIASHIAADDSAYYYYGINYNGRGQIGTKATPKGLQLGSLASNTANFSKTGVWLKLRYEYSGNAAKKVTGYFNDIQQSKSGAVDYAIKAADQKADGSIGFVACANKFTFKNFKVGALSEKPATILMKSNDGFDTLQGDAKYIMMLDNEMNLRVGKELTVEVSAKDKAGADAAWSVGTSNDAVLTATKAEDGKSFTIKAVAAMKDGDKAVVTLVNDSDNTVSRTFTAATIKNALNYEDVDYGAEAKISPKPAAENVFEDTKLVLTFDSEPQLVEGAVSIYEVKADGTIDETAPVDVISVGSESNTIGGTALTLKNFMIQKDGNDVIITPHTGKLANGKEYAVGIPKYVITGKINGKVFLGYQPSAKKWTFKTRASKPAAASEIVVGSSEAASFRTIQGALDVIGTSDATIKVEKGTYYEVIQAKNNTGKITIVGDTTAEYGADVVIKGINCNSYNGGTAIRASFYAKCDTLTLKNVTIQNAYDRNVDGTAQSEAIFMQGKTLVAYNCSFKGFQDTIQTQAKTWMYKCYIEGDTDFIWGQTSVALFENCKIKMLNTNNDKVKADSSYIFETRIGDKSVDTVAKGFVLFNSEVEALHEGGNYLARRATAKNGSTPTTYYDQAAFINVKFAGTPGLSDKLWGGPNVKDDKCEPEWVAKDAEGNMNVGWKIYGGSGWNTAAVNEKEYFGTITEAVYNAEYSGRNVILNKVFNKKSGKYEPVTEIWDTAALATEFGAPADTTVVEAAKCTLFTFDFSKLTKDAKPTELAAEEESATKIGCSGLKIHGTAYGATTTGGTAMTFEIPVTGPCKIVLYPTYKGTSGTLTLNGADAGTFATNATTESKIGGTPDQNPENTKATITYTGSEGKATVVMTSTAGFYLWKVVVDYN